MSLFFNAMEKGSVFINWKINTSFDFEDVTSLTYKIQASRNVFPISLIIVYHQISSLKGFYMANVTLPSNKLMAKRNMILFSYVWHLFHTTLHVEYFSKSLGDKTIVVAVKNEKPIIDS